MRNDQTWGEFTLETLFRLLWRFRRSLFIAGVIGAVLGAFFSSPWFITPKYKATLVFYPTASQSISGALLDPNKGKYDAMSFGSDEEVDQLLQILESDDVLESVVSKFNLYTHYEIKPDSRDRLKKLYREYNSNIKSKRTQFNAIQVAVLDKSPDTASAIANYLGEMVDSAKNKMQRERARQAYEIVKTEYENRLALIAQINDSLDMLRRLGMFDYKSQSAIVNEQYTEALAEFKDYNAVLESYFTSRREGMQVKDSIIIITKARAKGAEARIAELGKKLETLAALGGRSVYYSSMLDLEQEKLAELKFQYDKAKVDYERILPQKYIINRAYTPEFKTYPVRWLITLISALATFFMAFVVVLLRSYRTEAES